MQTVFVSYSREDSAHVDKIVDALERADIDVWIDRADIKGGHAWRRQIVEAIERSSAFIIMLSSNSVQSDNVRKELDLAEGANIRVIPVELEPTDIPTTMKYQLVGTQRIDLSAEFSDGMSRLFDALEFSADEESRETPKRTSERSRRPKRILINKVQEFWVEGVLERSLHNKVLIDLGKEAQPQAVDHPWDAVVSMPDQEPYTVPADKKIIDIFDEAGGTLLILGEPGAGKTTTLLELARDTIARAERDPSHPIPVVFNLSSWTAERESIADWVVDELNVKYQIPNRFGRLWVENNELQLLLDGLDEIRPEYRESCAEAINQFRETHGLTDVVVCSRTEDYDALDTRLNLQGAIQLRPLTLDQINVYLDRLGPDLDALRHVTQSDPALQELAQTPLTLSIMSIAYKGLSSDDFPSGDDVDVAEHHQHLFDVYVDRMFDRVARTQDKSYPKEQTIAWLSWLARGMSQHGQSVFLLDHLQPSWLPYPRLRWFYLLGTRILAGISLLLPLYLLAFEVRMLWQGIAGGLAASIIALGLFERDYLSTDSVKRTVGATRISTLACSVLIVLLITLLTGALQLLLRPSQHGLSSAPPLIVVPGISLLFGLFFGLRLRWQQWRRDIRMLENIGWSWRRFAVPVLLILFASGAVFLAYVINRGAHQVALRNGRTGELVATLEGNLVPTVEYNADGTRLLRSAFGDRIRLHGSRTGKELAELPGSFATFSPDGTRMVTVSCNRVMPIFLRPHECNYVQAFLLDATTGNTITTLTKRHDWVDFAFSSDGTYLVLATCDYDDNSRDGCAHGSVRLLNGHSGVHLRSLDRLPPSWHYEFAFSPDGARLMASNLPLDDRDQTAWLLNSQNGSILAKLPLATWIWDADFSPDGRYLVITTRNDGTVLLLDARTGTLVRDLTEVTATFVEAYFNPDGTRLATTGGMQGQLWHPHTGELIASLERHSEHISSAAFNADGTRFATASRNDTALLWDGHDGSLIAPLAPASGEQGLPLTFSPGGTLVATAGCLDLEDRLCLRGGAWLWDARTGELRTELSGHTFWVDSIVFSPDGEQLVTAGDGVAFLWDVETEAVVATLPPDFILPEYRAIQAEAEFSSDGTRLITIYNVWDEFGIVFIRIPLLLSAVGLLFGIMNGLRFDVLERKTVPGQGVRVTIRNALLLGVSFSIASMLLLFTVNATPALFTGAQVSASELLNSAFYNTVIWGPAFVILFWLIALWFGGLDVLQHFILRLLSWCSGCLPLRATRFLDYATERIFLQKVGGGYIFIHRMLLEYFAAMTEDDIEQLAREIEAARVD